MTFAFHISRDARERYDVEHELFTLTGNAILPDFAAGRRLAQRMNAVDGRGSDPARVVHAGQLNAMGLLDEILHAAVAMYRREVDPEAVPKAYAAVAGRVGEDRLTATLETFVARFPTADAMRLSRDRDGRLARGFSNTGPNWGHLNATGHRIVGEAVWAAVSARSPRSGG